MEAIDQTFIECWSLLEEALEKLKKRGSIRDFERKGPGTILRGRSFFLIYKNDSSFRIFLSGSLKYAKDPYIVIVSANNCFLEKDLATFIEKRLPKDRIITEEKGH